MLDTCMIHKEFVRVLRALTSPKGYDQSYQVCMTQLRVPCAPFKRSINIQSLSELYCRSAGF